MSCHIPLLCCGHVALLAVRALLPHTPRPSAKHQQRQGPCSTGFHRNQQRPPSPTHRMGESTYAWSEYCGGTNSPRGHASSALKTPSLRASGGGGSAWVVSAAEASADNSWWLQVSQRWPYFGACFSVVAATRRWRAHTSAWMRALGAGARPQFVSAQTGNLPRVCSAGRSLCLHEPAICLESAVQALCDTVGE
eukprot:356577-Chlamydomonas_euryale.AAC.2